MSEDTEVLIAGAGPTGLALALWLTKLGVGVRIIDAAPRRVDTSRALAVHARTLELYDLMGLTSDLLKQGVKFKSLRLWAGGRQRAKADFGDMGKGLSPYPFALIYPQDDHERWLGERLADLGVNIERPLALAGLTASEAGVEATLTGPGGDKAVARAAYAVGCDGAHSVVRHEIGGGFPGGTYSRLFYVADVEASGPVVNGDLNVALDEAGFLAVFPLSGQGRIRLIGDTTADADGEVRFEDIGHAVADHLGIEFKSVRWFSNYRVHHRVADRWRCGRLFLAGDAAHLHSPVGGQGMNTGIGDAVNLAWKLAAVIKGRAKPAILDSYQPERMQFARQLVSTTDNAFELISRDGPVARFIRLKIVPAILPALAAQPAFRRLMFRTVSQIGIRYRTSRLSSGAVGRLHGGDRMAWIEEADNFAALDGQNWRVQCFGPEPKGLAESCARLGLTLDRFAWSDAVQRAGVTEGAIYLLRPDGYIGLATRSVAQISDYGETHGLKFSQVR